MVTLLAEEHRITKPASTQSSYREGQKGYDPSRLSVRAVANSLLLARCRAVTTSPVGLKSIKHTIVEGSLRLELVPRRQEREGKIKVAHHVLTELAIAVLNARISASSRGDRPDALQRMWI